MAVVFITIFVCLPKAKVSFFVVRMLKEGKIFPRNFVFLGRHFSLFFVGFHSEMLFRRYYLVYVDYQTLQY